MKQIITSVGRSGGGGGGGGTTPSNNNQGMAGLLATAQGQSICATGMTATPVGRVDVYLNSQRLIAGDAVKTKDFYWSADAGTTARALSALVLGDKAYLGTTGVTTGGTDANDLISFSYNI